MYNEVRGITTKGSDKFAFAPVIFDSALNGYMAGDTTFVRGLVSANYAPNSTSNPFYADNGLYENETSFGNQEVTHVMAGFTPLLMAQMIGGSYQAGAYSLGSDFYAKERAEAYRISKGKGVYQYVRFWKGTYSFPAINAQTKAESIEYQTSEFTFNAVNSDSKGKFVQIIQSDDPRLVEMGITPEELDEKFYDFNWDPFADSPAFAEEQTLKITPSVVEASLLDGSVKKPVLLGLTSGAFKDSITGAELTATNLPADLAIGAVEILQPNVIRVEISGTATSHTATDNVNNATIEVSQTAIVDGAAALKSKEFSVEFK